MSKHMTIYISSWIEKQISCCNALDNVVSSGSIIEMKGPIAHKLCVGEKVDRLTIDHKKILEDTLEVFF